MLESTHELQIGDVIISIDGVSSNILDVHASYHIRLFHRAGDTMNLGVIRNGTTVQIPLQTQRQVFRRVED